MAISRYRRSKNSCLIFLEYSLFGHTRCLYTVCLRSSDPYYIVKISIVKKWATTSWTHSIYPHLQGIVQLIGLYRQIRRVDQ